MAEALGTIVQSIGAVIDIEFPREAMPGIYDALVLEDSAAGGLVEKGLTFEVEQQLGDRPQMDKLIGAVKVMLDGYTGDRFDRLMLAYTRFINTMKQEPVIEQLLPLSGERLGAPESVWDYLYEPEARAVLDQVMTRYIEALIFQAVSENMASEQSARMVAMKAASDNAATLIDELTLVYNKNRQANITKELSEIVGGAAAV